ncbi:MAG: hypothetical protein P8103_13855 [Candidatus Thiodiazotropha sp.]
MENGKPLILHLRALGWALNLVRMNLILLLLTSVLLSVPQGHDLLRGMAEDGGLDYLSLFGSTLLWATSLWLWARVLLDIDFPYALVDWQQLTPYRKLLPRLLGVLAFAAVTLNLGIVTEWHATAYLMGIEGILFFLAVTYRRQLGRWIARRLRPDAPETHWAWAERIGSRNEPPPRLSLYRSLGEVRGRIAAATFVLGLLLFAWGMLGPLSMGRHLDTLLLLMLWGATMLPLASVITYHATRKGVPIVIISLFLVAIFSFWNDNHAIRQLDSGLSAQQRPALEDALTQWHDAHCDANRCDPFILVATAGGGIRAAYWTGTLLGTLQDATEGRFDDHLFAISGVSGGSVGATVYRVVTANRDTDVTKTIQQILGQDYLGPVAAGLLYKDAVQRLLPLPLLGDRAEIFEQGLETGFTQFSKTGGVTLDSSFIGIASLGGRPWPALFLNSTWSDNGRRIVAATLRTDALAPPASNRVLYKDLLTTLGGDMRLSTAAHNSARFPFVSPPGGWKPADSQRQEWQRLQDGGLFENYGAETALEIANAAERLWQQKWRLSLHPYVILISSDPTLPAQLADYEYNTPLGFGYEVLSTLRSYATSRNGHGIEAASRLHEWVVSRDSGSGERRFFHLRMCPGEDKEQEPPLGWSLSATAQGKIDHYLSGSSDCSRENAAAVERVASLLKAAGS